MPKNQNITFDKGLADARDPATLRPGELQKAVGCEYRVGTPHCHKQLGRTSTSTALGAKIQALYKFQYDLVTDRLIAVADGSIYESDVSTSPSFGAAQVSGLSTTVVPSFAALNDLWLSVNGVDANYIRESGDVPGGSQGAWRTLGMIAPSFQPVLSHPSQGTHQRAYADTSTWINGSNAYDNGSDRLDTYASTFVESVTSSVEVFSFDTNHAGSSRKLKIKHQGLSSEKSLGGGASLSESSDFNFGNTTVINIRGRLKIESTENFNAGMPTWTEIYDARMPYAPTSTEVDITDGLDLRDTASGGPGAQGFAVRVTVTVDTIFGAAWVVGRVFDVNVNDGGNDIAFTTTNTIQYFFTERYIDSDGLWHESAASPTAKQVAFTSKFGVTVTLPGTGGRKNSFAQRYVIYRSLDTTSGGYPNLYEIGDVATSSVSFNDIFEYDLILATDKDHIYAVLTILYPDGSSLQIPINMPPPVAKLVIPFQGSMVYVPNASSRLFYSIPATISSVGIEQVPELYYLDFISDTNDTIKSIRKANNGRVMIVYFERYSMLVLALPQATDPGMFDQRITEYVSNRRGCSGTHATTEITLTSGLTLSIAADALGVWATDGVSIIHEWSNDFDWETHMDGVTLANIQLEDNAEMRRVEMLYEDSNGDRKEVHFFYGRMKAEAETEREVPLITGPHPAGVQTKHYNTVDGDWTGWSGDATITGDVFIERQGTSDAANGYTATPNAIPFQVKTANFYVAGLGRAVLTQFGYPLFASTPATDVTLVGVFTRDGAPNAFTKTKVFTVGTDKKIYWHAYADKHSLEVKHINSDDMPALIGYTVEITDAGIGREL